MSRHAAVEAQAAQWLAAEADPEGLRDADHALRQWLDADTAHRVAYLRLRRVWRAAHALRAQPAAAAPPATATAPAADRAPRRAALAAGLLLLAGATLWRRDAAPGPAAAVELARATPVGGRDRLGLADGSQIELGTDSQVRAQIGAGQREVWLERGEAYFDVAPDAARPFVVHAGARRITVLGTRFAVRLGKGADDVRVVVTQGRVKVEGEGASGVARVELRRGNALTVQERRLQVELLPEPQLMQRLAWRQQQLVFDDTTLAEAAAEFNRYHTRPLVIEGEAAQHIRIGGQFDAGNLDGFTHLLREGMRLRVQVDADRITVSR